MTRSQGAATILWDRIKSSGRDPEPHDVLPGPGVGSQAPPLLHRSDRPAKLRQEADEHADAPGVGRVVGAGIPGGLHDGGEGIVLDVERGPDLHAKGLDGGIERGEPGEHLAVVGPRRPRVEGHWAGSSALHV